MSKENIKVLCEKYWNEYIFRISYEISPSDYKHLLLDVATFRRDNVEVLLEVISTAIWAKEHHHLTRHIPEPYILMALYSMEPNCKTWSIPTEPKCNLDYRHKSCDLWLYLVCLLQFWKDDGAGFRIWQGPI